MCTCAKSRDQPVSVPFPTPALGLQTHAATPGFYVCDRDPNADPQACRTSNSSAQPHKLITSLI